MIDTILINIKIEDQRPDAVGPEFQKTDFFLKANGSLRTRYERSWYQRTRTYIGRNLGSKDQRTREHGSRKDVKNHTVYPGQQRTKRLMRPGHQRKRTHVLRSRGEDKNYTAFSNWTQKKSNGTGPQTEHTISLVNSNFELWKREIFPDTFLISALVSKNHLMYCSV